MQPEDIERFTLVQGALLALPSIRPLEVASGGGTLWLTLDNDPRDLVLEPGERVLLEAPGRVLAHALENAVLEVRPHAQLPCPVAWQTRTAQLPSAQEPIAKITRQLLGLFSSGAKHPG